MCESQRDAVGVIFQQIFQISQLVQILCNIAERIRAAIVAYPSLIYAVHKIEHETSLKCQHTLV